MGEVGGERGRLKCGASVAVCKVDDAEKDVGKVEYQGVVSLS